MKRGPGTDFTESKNKKAKMARAKALGRSAALRDYQRTFVNFGTDEETDAYCSGFNERVGDEACQKIRRAKRNGRQAALQGNDCPEKDALITKGLSEPEAQAYIEAFQASAGNESEQKIRRAKRNGKQAALQGYDCPTEDALITKGLSEPEAQAYIEAFQASAGNESEQKIRRAKADGKQAALQGNDCPEKDALITKGRSEPEAQAYIAAFQANARDESVQKIRRARKNGRQAALQGYDCPEKDALITKGSSEPEAQAYIEAFQASAGNESEQKIRRAKANGRQAALRGYDRLEKEDLIAKGNSEPEAQAYIKAFQANAGNESEQKVRRARKNGREAALRGYDCPTEDALITKGLSEPDAQAYIAAHQENADEIQLNVVKRKARAIAQTYRADIADLNVAGSVLKPEDQKKVFNMFERTKKLKEKNELANKINRSRRAGETAASRKNAEPCPSDEMLFQRGYLPEQVKAYKEGYNSKKQRVG